MNAIAQFQKGDTKVSLASLPALAMFMCFALIGVVLWYGSARMTSFEKGQVAIVGELQAVTYMLSLPEGERPKLSVPPALRHRVE